MKGFPTSADIYLELDGRKIAVVQSYKAKAAKSSKNIEAFGESEPVATIEGQKSYTVELIAVSPVGRSDTAKAAASTTSSSEVTPVTPGKPEDPRIIIEQRLIQDLLHISPMI